MTNATSLHAFVQDRRTFVMPVVARPGILTFIAQGGIGHALGSYLLLLGYILSSYHPYNFSFVFSLPFLLTLGFLLGTLVGFFIWLFNKCSEQPLSRTFRATIAILLTAIGWFAWLLLAFTSVPASEVQVWVFLIVFVPGITIGLISGSSLRPGRELVRGGDAKQIVARIFAGLSGLVLRGAVVQLFLASVIAVIATLQSYFHSEPYFEQVDPRWVAVAFGHFALASVVLFARLKFEVLAVLTAIASTPVIASFSMFPDMPVELRYVLIGYLVAWALFLLSRWRQTDVALAVLNKELRYYLID